MSQDRPAIQKKYINCRGKLLDISVPRVMGILNITPDSFYDGGRYGSADAVLRRAEAILEEGGDVIDIGGLSTRPGAAEISAEEEAGRVVPVVQLLRQRFPEAVLSVDTYRSQVAEQAVNAGADIINDISGGTMDPQMFGTVARLRVPYILMHIQGVPATMQENPQYDDVVKEVCFYFSEKTDRLIRLGVCDIILDPGYGFGKTVGHNFSLLKRQELIVRAFGLPLLAGVSRKSMVNRVTGTGPSGSLAGTIAASMIALQNGATLLRAHDVKDSVQAAKLFSYYRTIS